MPLFFTFVRSCLRMNDSLKYIRLWLFSGIALICAMVIIGGITRLTGSGLSMVEWKPITGIVPPLNESDWNLEFEKYKQFPEFQKLNFNMTLWEFKQIFFWEYLHRLLGRIIGVVFIIPFIYFYFKKWITRKMVMPMIIIFLLGGLQGFVGWYMVKSGLNSVPHVSHLRLALHQGMALILIIYIYWTILSLEPIKKIDAHSRKLFRLSLLAFFLLIVQITWGAFVAGLKAGYSYNNFPMMGESLFPNTELVAVTPYFYNGVLLQFTHRWLGFIVLIFFIYLFFKSKAIAIVHKQVQWLLSIAVIQVILGIFTLILSVPLVLGVAHQFVAILLILLMIKIIHIQWMIPETISN